MTALPWTRRLATAGFGAVALLLAGGIAYAAWSVFGSGSTTATSTTIAPLGVTTTVGAQLYPGGTTLLTVTVSNPNPRPVTVTSITQNGAITGCTTPDLTLTLPAVSLPVPAGGSASVVLGPVVAMGTSSSTDCQGVTFTIPLRATGASA